MNRFQKNNIKVQIFAGQAKPLPPVGPILGQYGINTKKFCEKFNAETEQYDKSLLLNVKIKVLNSDNYDVIISPPSTTFYLKRAFNFQKGKTQPNSSSKDNKKLDLVILYEIAKIRLILKYKLLGINLEPLNIRSLIEREVKSLIGSAKSMGFFLSS